MDAFQRFPDDERRDAGGTDASPAGASVPRPDHDVTGDAPVAPWSADRPPPGIRLPHPLECLRRRPPRWGSPFERRDPRDAGAPRPLVEGWREPALRTVPDLGPVRVNFTYSHMPMTAGYSDKARRRQFFEGPNEPNEWRLYEASPRRTDLQFQPMDMTWETAAGGTATYTLDGGVEYDDGAIAMVEIKSARRDFERAETAHLLAEAEKVLAALDVRLERVAGEDRDELAWRAIKDVFDDRRTIFDRARDVGAAHALIMREGGVAPLGRVLEAVGGHWSDAMRKVNAMMAARHLSYPLDAPPMRDAPVTIPGAPARPGALRAFLRQHVKAA